MREEESYKVAKRAVKISVVCVLITLILGLLNIYILVNEARAIVTMSKDIKALEEKVSK